MSKAVEETEKSRVLIVDDESACIMAFTEILSSEYTIYAAKSGQEAIELANQHLPDVILLDILMPEMDGYDVLSELKNSEATSAIPIIFITGLTNEEAEEKGLSMGASDYISKTCVPEIVRLRVWNQVQMANRIKNNPKTKQLQADTPSVVFGGGDGLSLETAFIISSKNQMEKLAESVNAGTSYSGSYFRIDCDIDMEGMEWTPIGYCVGPLEKRQFGGILDGGGHTISNFEIGNQGNRSVGLFGYIMYAVIQNLYVRDFRIRSGAVAGGLVGQSETSTIASCYSEGKIESESMNAGGIVGIACNSRVENSVSSILMNVQQGTTAGGLCGLAYNNSRFTNCKSQGRVRANNIASVGGFAGSVKDCAFENCHAGLIVTSTNCGNVGGFCGCGMNCKFDWCTASSSVRAVSDGMNAAAGGFIGLAGSMMTRCIASGNVSMSGESGAAGGFAGTVLRESVYLCYSCGSVASEGCAGGFAGKAHCDEGSTNIENCYTISEITSEDKTIQAGGFVGVMTQSEAGNVVINSCYSFGNLSHKVKGFTSPQSEGNISDCVWRKDENGINKYITDGRDVTALSTEQFGYENFFAGMGWNITGERGVWRYYDEAHPKRPHLNGLPLVNSESEKS